MTNAAVAQQGREYEAHSLEVGGGFPRYHEWLMAQFRPYLRGRVVELGAGIGTISCRYLETVDAAFLIEPATNLHQKLAENVSHYPHVRTACGFLDDVIAREDPALASSFDVAVMVNVLEHIEDDAGTVRSLFRLLKPGGKLLIFVPALPMLYGSIDEYVGHFRRYTRSSLGSIVEGVGFRVEKMQYFDLLGALPWFITGRLLKRAKVGEGSARIYDRFIVPICKVVDRVAAGPFYGPGRLPGLLSEMGKNLVCVAVKP